MAGTGAAAAVDVAVVGAGPVGTALAILLAQRGRSVALLERWPEPYPLPRAVHLDHETARILQACGLGADLAAITEPAEVYEWRNATGTTLLRFGRKGPGLSGWPQSSMFNQPALERLLAARAGALPGIDVLRGREVTALDADDTGVTVRHRPTGTGADLARGEGTEMDARVTRARYVVGCDGAGSTVRALMDAPVADLGFFHDWLIVDVVLHEPRVFDPLNLQVCDPARPSTAVSGGPGRRRWEFMRLPGERIDDLDREEVAWRFLAPWDVRPDNAMLERHAVYTFQARWAERWRRGRLFLAGDAAHQMPPFAGQGMCSGLRDGAKLAWKLDMALVGRAGDPVLDSYEAERRPDVCAVIDFSMQLGKVICVADPAAADRLDPALADWFGGIGGAVVTVGERGDLVDVDGRYDAWFAEHAAVAALQRPDFHLFGTANGEAGPSRLVADLCDALGAP
ncbi:MAG TPA: bifunctional 3-(3-hydroxy-phenyl)propionate/3-hydroxycinnamic acid hydroxylase [Acidimicrobiales bacterium]